MKYLDVVVPGRYALFTLIGMYLTELAAQERIMMKGSIVLVFVLLLFTACMDDSKDEMINEKDGKIKELENQLETVNISVGKLDETIKENAELRMKIDEMTHELEEKSKRLEELEKSNKDQEEKLFSYQNQPPKADLSIYSYDSGMIGMGESFSGVVTYNSLKIVGYNDRNAWEHELIDLSGEKTPTLKIEISGTLYDFKIEMIHWNDDVSEFEVEEEICSFQEITNTDILFDSVLAEGLPPELLTWKDNNGKEFYYLIGDSSLSGMTYPYIIISEMADLKPWWKEERE